MKIETNVEKVKEILRNPNKLEHRKYIAVHECVVPDRVGSTNRFEVEPGTSVFKLSESQIEMMKMMSNADCAQTFLLFHRQGGLTPRGEQLIKKGENENE